MDASDDLLTSAAMNGLPRTPKRGSAARLFGYDIFISFALGAPPRGTQSYASDLARRLRERDFTVFFSEDEASPGDELDAALRGALHRSKILVVIANRGTLEEPRWVRTEIEEFRRRHPTRPVIPISVGAALQDPSIAEAVQDWLGFRDKIWLDETQINVENGIASDAVVERLTVAPTRFKSNVVWRWVVRVVVAALAILAVGLAIATKSATDSAERARTELRRAVALRLGTEAQGMLAGARGEGDEQALLQLIAADRISPGAVDGSLLDALVSRQGLLKLAPYADYPCMLAFSPDSSRILVGGSRLRLLDATTGRPIGDPFEDTSGTTSVMAESLAYSSDGRLVATSHDSDVEIWDATTGKAITRLTGHERTVRGVAFSPDGRLVVSGGYDKTLRLWDARTGKLLRAPLTGHQDEVTSVAFSPDGRRIVSGSADETLRLWDAATGEPIGAPLTGHAGKVTTVAFTPDGSRVVSGGADGSVRMWNVANGQAIGAPLRGHDGEVTTVAVSARGDLILSGGADETLRLWDAATGQAIVVTDNGSRKRSGVTGGSRVASAVFSPDGRRIASCSTDDPNLRLWDARLSHPLGLPLEGHGKAVRSLAFSPDSSRIVSVGVDDALRMWDARSGRTAGALIVGHAGPVSSVAFSPDGSRIVSGSADKTVRLWDASSGKPLLAPFKGHEAAVTSVAFSPDGSQIVSGSADGMLRLWDAATGEPIGAPIGEPIGSPLKAGSIVSVSFSPDGRRIVYHGSDNSVRLWDAATRKSKLQYASSSQVFSVAFSPDGRYIVSGNSGGTLSLWDGTTFERLRSDLEAHTQSVLSVAFTPDSSRILSGSEDRTLRLWDVATGQPIGPPLQGHRSTVYSVAVSPDGLRMASGSEDGTLRLWPATRSWADELCVKLSRNMSRQQWREWTSPEIEYKCQCPGLPIPHDAGSEPPLCPGKPATPMFP